MKLDFDFEAKVKSSHWDVSQRILLKITFNVSKYTSRSENICNKCEIQMDILKATWKKDYGTLFSNQFLVYITMLQLKQVNPTLKWKKSRLSIIRKSTVLKRMMLTMLFYVFLRTYNRLFDKHLVLWFMQFSWDQNRVKYGNISNKKADGMRLYSLIISIQRQMRANKKR